MTDLTPKQQRTLLKLAKPLLPFDERAGYPGWPHRNLDLRSVNALERKGLAKTVIHRKNGIGLPCTVLTAEGNALRNRIEATE